MTQLERQIRSAQRRMWINRWLLTTCRMLTAAAAVFGAVVLVQRLFALALPVMWIGAGLIVAGFSGSVVWTVLKREGAAIAAATLDRAAGLRERLSSAQYCTTAVDPFAQAVVADAERLSGSLSARQHIKLVPPPSLATTALTMIVAGLMFLVPLGLLASAEATEDREQTIATEQAKIAVKKQMDDVRKLVETTPALADLQDKLEATDKEAGGRLQRPVDVRHEAVKKIDTLADAIKEKRENGDYDKVEDMRRMLRGLKSPKTPDAATSKLSQSLAKGDFKTAKEEVETLKEQLATLKADQDKELVEKMSKQLDDLAKQIEQLSKDDQLAKKLEQAGIKKEDIERLTENLKKNDLDQVRKQLEEKGLSPPQAEKLAKQLQQKMQSGSAAKKLAQAMQQGAKCNNPGQMGEAMAGLSAAGQQLSDLEQLEQEMNQLDSAMADLQNAGEQMGKPCSACNGTGKQGGKPCSQCNGTGQGGSSGEPGQGGMGKKPGQGRGGVAQSEEADVRFKTERGKVGTGRGAIVGQFLVDGEQVKGETSPDFKDVVIAAERDATDRINRNRIPRQYHKAIKSYFSTPNGAIRKPAAAGEAKPSAPDPEAQPESPPTALPRDGEGSDTP